MNNYYVIRDCSLDVPRNQSARIEQSTHPNGPVGEWWNGLNPRFADGVVCPITQDGPMSERQAAMLCREYLGT